MKITNEGKERHTQQAQSEPAGRRRSGQPESKKKRKIGLKREQMTAKSSCQEQLNQAE